MDHLITPVSISPHQKLPYRYAGRFKYNWNFHLFPYLLGSSDLTNQRKQNKAIKWSAPPANCGWQYTEKQRKGKKKEQLQALVHIQSLPQCRHWALWTLTTEGSTLAENGAPFKSQNHKKSFLFWHVLLYIRIFIHFDIFISEVSLTLFLHRVCLPLHSGNSVSRNT